MDISVLKSQDLHVFEEIFDLNVYGVQPQDVSGKNLIDVGSQLGMFSIISLEYGCNSVTAVEANVDTIPLLQSNLQEYQDRAKVIHAAVTGLGTGTVRLRRDICCPKVSSDGDIEVQSISLLECMGNQDDLVLKMDIEYAEFDVLFNQMGSTLRRFSTIFLEVHEMAEAMKHYLKVIGFEVVHRLPTLHWDYAPDGSIINPRESGMENLKLVRI